tara:strand:+ start:20030 stop:20677 length:648 start_codon:yes stop_codon:yes gene_type:complete
MSESDRALNVMPISHADTFADRFQSPRDTRNRSTIFLTRPETPLTEFINGFFKLSLGIAILALVGVGSVFAVNAMETRREIAPLVVASAAPEQSVELDALQTEVALLTEQSLEMRAELALLTGQGGVLPKLVVRWQDQRRVNAAHANAIQQLYATTSLIGTAMPPADAAASDESTGRPVQVTSVVASQDDTPKRVVLIPEAETDVQPNTEGGAGE